MTSHIQHDDFRNCGCLPFCTDGDGDNGNQPQQLRNAINEKHNEMKQTEDLLASELNKLSVQERAEAFNDVHCVGEELKETPGMIENSLAKFEVLVKKRQTPTYEMAWNQNRAYVEDPSFRLKFLRTNMYDVDKSVRQMMRFLHHKAKYFGDDKVARDITLDDLNEEDKEVLRSGLWHIQKGEDRTGRVIVHLFGDMIGRWKAENTVRAGYMIFFNILTRHPEVQRRGIVSMYHNVSSNGAKAPTPGIDYILTVSKVSLSFPIRYSAMHHCLYLDKGDLNRSNRFLGLALNVMPKYSKARSRIHVGSSMELQYQLRSHGIPLDTFPVDIHGNVRQNVLNSWLEKYKQEESEGMSKVSSSHQHHAGICIPQIVNQNGSTAQSSLPLHFAPQVASANTQSFAPSENDVLLGRGRFVQSRVGNVKFREFIEKHSGDYDSLTRMERQKRASELTQELAAIGVRFFKQREASSEWVEVDFAEARQRVSQMFRTLRKKNYR